MSIAKFQPQPPREQPFFEPDREGKPTSNIAKSWYQWISLLPARLTSPAVAATPATSGANGTAGQVTYDANFLYVCVAPNTWKRIALSAF